MANMHKKFQIFLTLVLVVAIGAMSLRLFVVAAPKNAEKVNTKSGVSYLADLETIDVAARESEIQKAQERYAASRSKDVTTVQKNPYKNVNFKAACKQTGTLFAGDSLVKAMQEYGILDKSQVIAEIGATTFYLNKNIKKIVKKKPRVLVLHLGENQLNDKAYATIFIKNYTKAIKALQKKLPHTRIYVDSIWPVTKKAIKKDKNLKNIPYYNKLLKEMSKNLGVTYLDFTPQWKGFSKNYYDADGVHPLKSYYSEHYLPAILTEEGYKIER